MFITPYLAITDIVLNLSQVLVATTLYEFLVASIYLAIQMHFFAYMVKQMVDFNKMVKCLVALVASLVANQST